MSRDIWNDKPVTFADFTVREGAPLGPAFEQGADEGSYLLLQLSLRWLDSGERVFNDVEEIWAVPYRLRPVLARLAAKAAFFQGLTSADPDEPVVTNGSGNTVEPASPSH